MPNTVRICLLASVCVVALSACQLFDPRFQFANLNEGDTLITDSKQRAITNITLDSELPTRNGRVIPRRIVCSEPSPDVAEAISNSLSLSLEAAKYLDNPLTAQLYFSTATSVAQLGQRLATIQLLRDELSALCRSYANGAVSMTTYTTRLSKLDNKMITLLMGEMAGSAIRQQQPMPVIINQQHNPDGNVPDPGQKMGNSGNNASASAAGAIRQQHNPDGNVLDPGQKQVMGNSGNNAFDSVVSLQRNFLDNDEFGTLLASCLSSMNEPPGYLLPKRVVGDDDSRKTSARFLEIIQSIEKTIFSNLS